MRIYIFIYLVLFILSDTTGQDSASVRELRIVHQATWQQQVNVDIRVKLNDESHELYAEERIEYINNSPNELTEIWFHLWPNAYRNDETPFAKQLIENGNKSFYFSNESERGYIDSLNFTVDGEKVELRYGSSIDVCYIKLNKPLKPGEYCIIKTPFHVKIPNSFSRLGHVNQSYQITQWYPKPAVYDVNGWNPIPYLDQGEFYSEFGKFKVAINVPDSYVVATSGALIEEKKLDNRKELIYIEDSIHDFAWFADKKYIVDSEAVVLESGKRVTCYMYYKNKEDNNLAAIKKAVVYRSKTLGEYPYSHVAAVASSIKAGAGMEYPCITVVMNGDEMTIEHEVGHNWFYGMLATYEREYAYMDEGFNSYYDIRYAEENTVKKVNDYKHSLTGFKYTQEEFQHRLLYTFQVTDNEDQPIYTPSTEFTSLNYGAMIYGKTALGLRYLEKYLGRPMMDSIVRVYFDTWKYKHPLPGDLRMVFENISGKNLSWFFEDILKTNKRIDYKILGTYIDKARPAYRMVDIENMGEINAPVIIGIYRNKSLYKTYIYEGFRGMKTFAVPDSAVDLVVIDPEGVSLEINRRNNIIRTHGSFKKVEPIKLKFGFGLDNPFRMDINWIPLLGFNKNDGMMIGLGIYNQSVYTKNNSFSLLPMYSFNGKTISGIATISKHIFFQNELTKYIYLKFEARKFQLPNYYAKVGETASYMRLSPEAEIVIQGTKPRSNYRNRFLLKYIYIENYSNKLYSKSDNFFNINFIHENIRTINPYQGNSGIQMHQDFQKIYTEWKGQVSLNHPNKNIMYRFFGGIMYYNKLMNPDGINDVYSFKPEANTGFWDYTYEQLMFNRGLDNKGFWQHQIFEKDGAFKTPYSFGNTSDTWLLSSNLRCPFPGKIPIEIFADFCLFDKKTFDATTKEVYRTPTFIYNTGIALILIRDVCEIYFPIYMTKSMQEAIFYKDIKYPARISWMLNIEKLNPFLNKRKLINQSSN